MGAADRVRSVHPGGSVSKVHKDPFHTQTHQFCVSTMRGAGNSDLCPFFPKSLEAWKQQNLEMRTFQRGIEDEQFQGFQGAPKWPNRAPKAPTWGRAAQNSKIKGGVKEILLRRQTQTTIARRKQRFSKISSLKWLENYWKYKFSKYWARWPSENWGNLVFMSPS